MSYLLDALKQSKHETMSAEQYDLQAQQLKQQRQLLTYRRISFLLAGSLVAVGILVSGFFVGKWLQQENAAINNSHAQNEISQTTLVQKKSEMLKETPSSKEKALETVSSAEVTSPELSQTAVPNSTPTIAGQLVYVQTPTGVQQMLLTPQGQYLSMSTAQSPQMQTQNYSTQNNVSPSFQPSNQPQSVQTQTAKRTLSADELSKYKVLGKPLNQTVPEQRPSSPSELDAVPDTLKNAFAQAVNNTEKAADYEVTQGSRLSSRVQPVELLPDGLQSMLPSIKYQAHIYSSTADKRWIKLNGRELYEGESIGALKVLEIAPDQSVLDFDGYEFSLKALQDWPQ
ncbi:general secretion pathway protein B [Pseudoalteromonas sp. BSi20311]|mgnify:CR=1 FL=1|jgi:general secretion pathway protein B|uniref:general secretion pathway protein GspB n=1 Tax=Pseudoalteromonas sp. BSi20311 TaxID=383911 RepID=UPI0002317BDA|nr:general secretion pathway protein GspB [Pseudoalteromonas sp. BSi20311]GAA63514.1 general secretion pathway protein B [Pseudoalteromonas sp. BSi20311]HCP98552.1 general secretion pathway protein GspB [Pseudoalteromonas sp.]|tara:strand:+ start:4199 stop:5224 length:1026 start_codon:yes stop_codon:yes gene_type:complete